MSTLPIYNAEAGCKDRDLSDLEKNALMVLKDCRPDCYLRRTKNVKNVPVYKLMDGDHNPITYIIATVLDRLVNDKFLTIIRLKGSDYLFKLSLDG